MIVVTALVGAIVALGSSLLRESEYTASALVKFNDQREELALLDVPVPPPVDPAQQVVARSRLVTDAATVDSVAEELGLSSETVSDSITTVVSPDTNLVEVLAVADSASVAAEIANAVAKEVRAEATATGRARLLAVAARIERNQRLNSPAARQTTAARVAAARSLARVLTPVEIVAAATPPEAATSPRPLRDTSLGLLFGLLFGALLALVRDAVDRRLRRVRDVEELLDSAAVGYIGVDAVSPGLGAGNGSPGLADAMMEPFQILRSNFGMLRSGQDGGAIAVTSAAPEEGKSTVAIGLARAAALAGRRVLLIECDLRRPVLANRLGIAPEPGLSDVLGATASVADASQPTPVETGGPPSSGDSGTSGGSLNTIVAGAPSAHPGDLLGSERFRSLAAELRSAYDVVIFDCTPLLPVSDALEVLGQVDAALLCVRLDRTTREQARAAASAIWHVPAVRTGLVITGVPDDGIHVLRPGTATAGRSSDVLSGAAS